MKITDIKTFLMETGGRDWVFCKVETDEGVLEPFGVAEMLIQVHY